MEGKCEGDRGVSVGYRLSVSKFGSYRTVPSEARDCAITTKFTNTTAITDLYPSACELTVVLTKPLILSCCVKVGLRHTMSRWLIAFTYKASLGLRPFSICPVKCSHNYPCKIIIFYKALQTILYHAYL